MRGFSKLKPSQRHTAWDPRLIIQYWMDQLDNMVLKDEELAYKSFALLAVAVWPRCSYALIATFRPA